MRQVLEGRGHVQDVTSDVDELLVRILSAFVYVQEGGGDQGRL